MSYCRWSSDDFWCDIYCYEDLTSRYTIHVACNRVVGDIPKTPHIDPLDDIKAFMGAHRAQMEYLETAEREPIGLPHDGESFSYATPGEAADKLEELMCMGYHVPEYAIEELREEQDERY